MKHVFCGSDLNPVIWPMSFFLISLYEDMSFDVGASPVKTGCIGGTYFFLAALYNNYLFRETFKNLDKFIFT